MWGEAPHIALLLFEEKQKGSFLEVALIDFLGYFSSFREGLMIANQKKSSRMWRLFLMVRIAINKSANFALSDLTIMLNFRL